MISIASISRRQKWLLHSIGLLVFLPFTYYRGFYPINTFYTECIAILTGIIVFTLSLFDLRQKRLRLPRIVLLPFGLAAVIAMQMAISPLLVMASGQFGILYLLWAALIMMAAQHAAQVFGLSRLADCVAWYLLAGGLWNVLSELNHLDGSELFGLGTIGQSNQLCDYLFLSCFSLLYLFARQLLGWRVLLFCLLLLTAELGLASSRSGVLYLFAGGVLVGLWRRIDEQVDYQRLRNGYILFALLYIGWQIAYPLLGYTTGMTRLATAANDTNTPSQRLFFWKDAWYIFLKYPCLGAGFGEFDWAFFMHGETHDHSVINNRVEHAHNIFMQLLAEMGMAGTLWLIVTGGLWLKRILQNKHDSAKWWYFALLSVMGIHSFLEYPLWLSNFLGIFAVLLGASDSRYFELKLSGITRSSLCLIPVLGLYLLINTGLNNLKLEKFYEAVAESRPLPGNLDEIIPISNSGLLAPIGLKYFAFNFKFNSEQAAEKSVVTNKALHFEPIPPLAYKQAVYLAYLGKKDESRMLLHLAASSYPNELNWFLSQVDALNQADKSKLAFLFADKPGQIK